VRTVLRKSFERDLKKIKDRWILEQIKQVVEEAETAVSLQEVSGVKRLSGAIGFYRIRIGEYRIGVVTSATEASEIEFVRCLHRREIYRYFP
jgi:mRNA interferase RelE/StbE